MDLRLAKSVQRVSVVQNGASQVVFKRKKKKKAKNSPGVGMIEKVVRRVTEGDSKVINSYLKDHNKSRKKRRDGWITDLPRNILRSDTKFRKPVKKLVAIN